MSGWIVFVKNLIVCITSGALDLFSNVCLRKIKFVRVLKLGFDPAQGVYVMPCAQGVGDESS